MLSAVIISVEPLQRKTSYVVNKGDPSRAKSYCNICVYPLAVLLEAFSQGMHKGKSRKQGNILVLTSICCICIYVDSTAQQ